MNENWEKLSDTSFIGDLYDRNHRRISIIVNSGVAVFVKCSIEKHFLMKEDFEKYGEDLSFVEAGKVVKSIPVFSTICEKTLNMEEIQEISEYLMKTI